MRKSARSKLILGLICFLLGFFTHLFLTRANFNYSYSHNESERIPVNPDEFDQTHMDDQMEKRFGIDSQNNSDINVESFDLSPKRREDDKYVYFEITNSKRLNNNKINVEVKDGYIHLQLDAKDSNTSQSMEQVFTIDSNLDETKAEVLNEKEKIVIRVPKKKV